MQRMTEDGRKLKRWFDDLCDAYWKSSIQFIDFTHEGVKLRSLKA